MKLLPKESLPKNSLPEEPLHTEFLCKEFGDAGIDCITILLSLVPYHSRPLLTVLEALSEKVGPRQDLRASVMAYKLVIESLFFSFFCFFTST